MSSPLSRLAETLIGSEIVKLGADVKEKIRQGNKIYNYTIGDFDGNIFPIPAAFEHEIKNAYKQHYTTYPPADGILELRKSIADFLQKRASINYDTNEIMVAAGGRPLIYAAYRAIVDKGDKVVYPVPSWNNNHYVHFNEGVHVAIETKLENNFMPTAEELAPHIKGATLLALCSPLNPTGTVFKKEDLEAICDLIIAENNQRGSDEKKLYLMYDQIYWTLTFGDIQHYNPISLRPEMRAYTIFIDGISKSFAATGVRVGWAMGPEKLIAKMKAINSHVGAWAPMAEQKGLSEYLKQEEAIDHYFTHFKQEVSARLSMIFNGIISLKNEGYSVDAIAPQAAIYLTIQFNLVGKKTASGRELNTQQEVTAYLLNEAGLAVVPFTYFGATETSSWYRLSVGTCKKEEINEMLNALRNALSALQ